ncbi:hypothetical protein [Streptomyces silvensis]|uniref:hypothetical protein n=1 Tax=Streptomyces silvensis TaxID=1765722 RepID=UPI000B033D9B|nr:hypothetical protein [Streptomyces silvensis]
MDLTPYLDDFRQELAVAADAGGAETRALARQLTGPLQSAARLTLLNALCAAMGEVNRDLAPGSVVVQLRGLDPEFVVTPPPAARKRPAGARSGAAPDAAAPALPLSAAGPCGGSIRLQFDTVTGMEQAAELFEGVRADREDLSLHLPSDCSVADVRAVLDALDGAAVEATAITVHRATLDDVFHSLVGPLQPEGGLDFGFAGPAEDRGSGD